jgi:hypothetical protein
VNQPETLPQCLHTDFMLCFLCGLHSNLRCLLISALSAAAASSASIGYVCHMSVHVIVPGMSAVAVSHSYVLHFSTEYMYTILQSLEQHKLLAYSFTSYGYCILVTARSKFINFLCCSPLGSLKDI